jgi:hypothetical protein
MFTNFELNKIKSEIKKFIYLKILKRKYYRVGNCAKCGRCCKNIYVKHGKSFISDPDLFNKLKPLHPFYFDLEIIGKDEVGLLFACKNLDEAARTCKIHNKRAKICRDYPMEEILKMGGTLAEGCGYRFEPIEKFSEILDKMSR